jgi:hypothetical protein
MLDLWPAVPSINNCQGFDTADLKDAKGAA